MLYFKSGNRKALRVGNYLFFLFIMKKFFILLTAVLFAVNAFAQFEQGAIRIGGASSLGFSNTKYKGVSGSLNYAELGIDGGYFFMDNLSANLTLSGGFEKDSDDSDATSMFGAELGVRYYLPMKVFAGAGFEYSTYKYGGYSSPACAAHVRVGYAAFLTDNIAVEPVIGYRIGLGLTDDMKANQFNRLSFQIGFSLFF